MEKTVEILIKVALVNRLWKSFQFEPIKKTVETLIKVALDSGGRHHHWMGMKAIQGQSFFTNHIQKPS